MRAILVANIKGGCGKTTVATHLAAASARAGQATVLADADRQRSALGWVARRPAAAASITGIDWVKGFTAPPSGTQRLIIDAPAALRGKEIEELVRMADVIVLPVLPGAFDEAATQRFLGKLEELKPIAKSRKQVAVVGNRMRLRTRSSEQLERFLASVGHTVVTRLRDSQIYAEVAATGLSLFDLTGRRASEHRSDWVALLSYVEIQG